MTTPKTTYRTPASTMLMLFRVMAEFEPVGMEIRPMRSDESNQADEDAPEDFFLTISFVCINSPAAGDSRHVIAPFQIPIELADFTTCCEEHLPQMLADFRESIVDLLKNTGDRLVTTVEGLEALYNPIH